jgi:hypothetical protein
VFDGVTRSTAGRTTGSSTSGRWAAAGRRTSATRSFQPFLSHTTKDAWTFAINTESSYDWKHKQWTVPIDATVSKLTRIGKQPISLGVGARYYAESPTTGPHGWGARLIATLLFPE